MTDFLIDLAFKLLLIAQLLNIKYERLFYSTVPVSTQLQSKAEFGPNMVSYIPSFLFPFFLFLS